MRGNRFYLIKTIIIFSCLLSKTIEFFTENCINFSCSSATASRNGNCIDNDSSPGSVLFAKCPRGTFCNAITFASSGSGSLQKCIAFSDFFEARLNQQNISNKSGFIPVNYYCKNNSDCKSNSCINNTCIGIPAGAACTDTINSVPSCELNFYCGSSGVCVAKKPFGAPCTKDYECQNTGGCFNSVCTEYYSLATNYSFNAINLDKCLGSDCGPYSICQNKKCVKATDIGANCISNPCSFFAKCNNNFVCEKSFDPIGYVFPNVYCGSNFATLTSNGNYICVDIIVNQRPASGLKTCTIADTNSCTYNYSTKSNNLQYFFSCGCDSKSKSYVCQDGTNDDATTKQITRSRNDIIKTILSLCPRNFPFCQDIVNIDLYQKDIYKYINSGLSPIYSDSTEDLGIQMIIGNLIVYELCDFKPEQITNTNPTTTTTNNATPLNEGTGSITQNIGNYTVNNPQTVNQIGLDSLWKSTSFTSSTINSIQQNLASLINKYSSNPSLLSQTGKYEEIKNIKTNLNQYIDSYVSSLNNKSAQPDKNIYDLVSKGIDLNQLLVLTNQNQTNQANSSEVLKDSKYQISNITQGILNYSITFNQNLDVFHETIHFTVQIIDKNKDSTKNFATTQSNGDALSIVDLKNCEDKIKQNIKSSRQLIASQVDYNSNLNEYSNDTKIIGHVSYDVYNPKSGEKLDISQQCKEEPITVKIPLTNFQDINKTQYDNYINKGVNIYDKKSDFYNSRCNSFSMTNDTGGNYDVTLNKRRKGIFPNISISCGDNCEFAEIDPKNYTVCKCISTSETNVFMEKIALDLLSSTNIGIFICATSINNTTLTRNIGFYFNLSTVLGTFFAYGFYWYFVYRNSITNNLKKIHEFDGVNYKYNDIVKEYDIEMTERFTRDKTIIDGFSGKTKEIVNIQKNVRGYLTKRKFLKMKKIHSQLRGVSEMNIEENKKNVNNKLIIKDDKMEDEPLKDKQSDNILFQINSKKSDEKSNQNKFVSEGIDKNSMKREYNILQSENYENILFNSDKFINDYEELKMNEIIELDKRSIRQFLWHMLITRHNFFFTFIRFSLFYPIIIRLIKYLLFISLNFLLNAIFFSDQYIEEKASNDTNPNLLIAKNEFLYSLLKLIWKSILSAAICWIPLIVLNILTDIPNELKKKIFIKIKTMKTYQVAEIYKFYIKSMKIKFWIFFTFSGTLILLSWYYTIVFCSIYKYSSIVWFYGGVISILIDFLIQMLKILLVFLIRLLLFARKDSKFLKFFYFLFLKYLS